jgi:hypothetical protein
MLVLLEVLAYRRAVPLTTYEGARASFPWHRVSSPCTYRAKETYYYYPKEFYPKDLQLRTLAYRRGRCSFPGPPGVFLLAHTSS